MMGSADKEGRERRGWKILMTRKEKEEKIMIGKERRNE